MTSTLPNIDRDRIAGFQKMAKAVIDDMAEAATDMASRHDHMVDGLKARVAELEAQLDKAAAQHAAQFFGLTVADLAEVLKEEAEGEDDAAVKQCLVLDDGDIVVVDTVRNLCSEVRRLCRELDVRKSLVADLQAKKARPVAVVADLPVEAGPFVITMKAPSGRRWWDAEIREWDKDLGNAVRFPTRADAEAGKPRKSAAVVTLADARELIEAEKVTSIAASAAAPGPEAA